MDEELPVDQIVSYVVDADGQPADTQALARALQQGYRVAGLAAAGVPRKDKDGVAVVTIWLTRRPGG